MFVSNENEINFPLVVFTKENGFADVNQDLRKSPSPLEDNFA